jgi:DNA mismatch repair ATPase MutL
LEILARTVVSSIIVILELIANAYDAGATTITIRWPSEKGSDFSVADNGTGMNQEGWTLLDAIS